MDVLLSSAYLPPVAYLAAILRADAAHIEAMDHYAKQTLRNRALIASPQGPQALTIPVVKAEGKQLMRDVRISDHGQWRHLHWQALRTAYNASPFFEFYADDFAPFYEQRYEFLFDFNLRLLHLLLRLIDIPTPVLPTTRYEASAPVDLRDFRRLPPACRPYYQVFAQRQGFLAGLSAVDLLFNMGPESLLIL